jgi:hypothetical protein
MVNLKKIILSAAAITAALCCLCTFNADSNRPLTLERIDTLGDTVSAFPTLRFAFSEPIIEGEVSIGFEPDCMDYHTEVNNTKDSFSIVVTGILAGRTSYCVFLSTALTSASGAAFSPGRTSFTFHTYAAEVEPDDAEDSTNLFYNPICGTIERVNDTDVYFLPNIAAQTLRLSSYDGGVFGLRLSAGSDMDTSLTGDEPEKSLFISGSSVTSGFLRVYSIKSTGHYELRAQ